MRRVGRTQVGHVRERLQIDAKSGQFQQLEELLPRVAQREIGASVEQGAVIEPATARPQQVRHEGDHVAGIFGGDVDEPGRDHGVEASLRKGRFEGVGENQREPLGRLPLPAQLPH